ncbi:MAG TPA: tetratricopeptide repeat protein [Geobacteraceae bacterium]
MKLSPTCQHESLEDLIDAAFRQYTTGNLAEAEAISRKVMALAPDSAEKYKNGGNTLLSLGRLEEAERAYRQALVLKPDYAEAYNNLGNVLRLRGHLADAEQAFRQALKLLPESAEIHNNFGNVLMDLGRVEDAEHTFRQAVVLRADFPLAHFNRGNALRALGRNELAAKCYLQALELNPDYAEAHFALGCVLELSGQLDEAAQAYGRTLALNPDRGEAYIGLGNVLLALRRVTEAEQAYRQSLALNPGYGKAYIGLGNALVLQERLDEAEDVFRRALTLNSESAEACIGLGNVFQYSGRIAEAEQAYVSALALEPRNASLKYNLSLLHLLQGHFEEGLELYEQRLEDQVRNSFTKALARFGPTRVGKRWAGEPLDGRSLLVVTEQGAGDSLMMMRYLPLLKLRGDRYLAVSCEPHLARVFRSIASVDGVITGTDVLPVEHVDFHCPIMSLPYLLQTRLESIPADVPYLVVPDEMRLGWRNRLANLPGIKVGLVWAGNRMYAHDAWRSVPLHRFSDLAHIEGVRLVSLQKGEDAGQWQKLGWGGLDWMGMCDDYLDTAALVSELDLVISVDTSVAHLAGALGKPIWLLNRYESEWRWMLDRKDSPWYPTMSIFRQEERGNWNDVIERVAGELARMVKP